MMGLGLDQSHRERRFAMRKKIMIRQLAVSVSVETWNKILEVTDREEISISSWIREAIEKSLDYKNKSGKESIS